LPVFEYEALSEDGIKSRGIVDAESEAGVRSRLRSEGKYLVKVEPAGLKQQRAAAKG
jgi:type II secretory pathway component PulF